MNFNLLDLLQNNHIQDSTNSLPTHFPLDSLLEHLYPKLPETEFNEFLRNMGVVNDTVLQKPIKIKHIAVVKKK